MDMHGGLRPFKTDEEKLRFLLTPQNIQLGTPLPCSSSDCLNMAAAATADFDVVEGSWVVAPYCKECTEKVYRVYVEGE